MRFARNQALSLFAFAIFSALDVGSDLLYITTEPFYDVKLWYAGIVFLVLPNYPFFRKMYELSVQPRFIIPFAGQAIWLGIKEGRVTIKNADLPKSISFENHDSFVKIFVYLTTWVVLIVAQIVWGVCFCVVYGLNFVLFWVPWVGFGCFLLQTKAIAIRPVWNMYFRVLMGTTMRYKQEVRKAKKNTQENKTNDGIIDYELLNESIFSGSPLYYINNKTSIT